MGGLQKNKKKAGIGFEGICLSGGVGCWCGWIGLPDLVSTAVLHPQVLSCFLLLLRFFFSPS